jgi:hypothetical protein
MISKKGRALADVLNPLDDELDAPKVTPEPVEPSQDTRPVVVPLTIFIAPNDRDRLRRLSLDSGTSIQKLGHEAWNNLLISRGLAPLQSVNASVASGRRRR